METYQSVSTCMTSHNSSSPYETHLRSLEKLPFEDEYFDYVRICNIALGVPEDEVSTSYPHALHTS